MEIENNTRRCMTYNGVKQSPSTANPGGGRGRQNAKCDPPASTWESDTKKWQKTLYWENMLQNIFIFVVGE